MLADQVKYSKNGKKDALLQLNEMIRYDSNLRHLIVEKDRNASEMLDFLFGRQLQETITMFGLKIKEDE
jgi:phage tail sheath gpL-like